MAAQFQMQPQVQVANAASSGRTQSVTSLYVGDLDANVTDSQLYDLFSQVGDVVSVRVCRDSTSQRSLGYGYVNYDNAQDSGRALEELNFTPINGKPIRVMYSHRDPSVRKNGAGNIYVKEIDRKALHETFSSFGSILSCKVATDALGQSLGYSFVQFASEESALRAIEKLNGMLLNGKQVYVGPFLRKQEREVSINKAKFTNVFVKNFSESITEYDLKKIFGQFGLVTSTVVMKNEDGTSKCFGFVNFENAEDAARAVESLSGQKFDNKEWYVGRAQKKSERELELKQRFDQSVQEAVYKSQRSNLYVKNLDESIDDDKLKELFLPFGSITSCKVMRDLKGISTGSGFVAFASPDEASRALLEMNSKIIACKPLYVAFAQRKEDRRAWLQAQFGRMRPIAMLPTVAPRTPMYFSGGPGLGHQIVYGQPPSAIIPPEPGYGYQHQLVHDMRPAGPLMPNMFVPPVQQGQQGLRHGGRRSYTVPVQGGQQPVPLVPWQMLPRRRGYLYSTGRGMPMVPYDDGGMSQPIPVGALASVLANASPTEQRMMVGEKLYPLVEQLEPEAAAKVTGMLLEMDQTEEVLHLLESPEALKAKVSEAMEVLRNVSQQQAIIHAEQLASLSLNE